MIYMILRTFIPIILLCIGLTFNIYSTKKLKKIKKENYYFMFDLYPDKSEQKPLSFKGKSYTEALIDAINSPITQNEEESNNCENDNNQNTQLDNPSKNN